MRKHSKEKSPEEMYSYNGFPPSSAPSSISSLPFPSPITKPELHPSTSTSPIDDTNSSFLLHKNNKEQPPEQPRHIPSTSIGATSTSERIIPVQDPSQHNKHPHLYLPEATQPTLHQSISLPQPQQIKPQKPKPYQCPQCEYRCSLRSYLNMHLKTHTGKNFFYIILMFI